MWHERILLRALDPTPERPAHERCGERKGGDEDRGGERREGQIQLAPNDRQRDGKNAVVATDPRAASAGHDMSARRSPAMVPIASNTTARIGRNISASSPSSISIDAR